MNGTHNRNLPTTDIPTHRRRRRRRRMKGFFSPFILYMSTVRDVPTTFVWRVRVCGVRAGHSGFVLKDVCVKLCNGGGDLCVNELNSRGIRNHQGWDVGAFDGYRLAACSLSIFVSFSRQRRRQCRSNAFFALFFLYVVRSIWFFALTWRQLNIYAG